MATIRSFALAVVTAVLVGTGTAGCGASSASDTPSPKDLYTQARSSALSAKSARLTGTVVDGGKTMTIDLAGTVDGANQKAVVTVAGEGTVTLLTVKKKVYINGDKAYWKSVANATVAKRLTGKWVQLSVAQAPGVGDLNIGTLLTEMFKEEWFSTLSTFTTKTTKGTVSGVPAYIVKDRFGGGGELSVSADGEAWLLRIDVTGGNEGHLEFSEWNAVKPFKAPKVSQVIKV